MLRLGMNKQHEEDIQIQIIIDYDRRHLLTDKLYYFKSTNGPDLFRKKKSQCVNSTSIFYHEMDLMSESDSILYSLNDAPQSRFTQIYHHN